MTVTATSTLPAHGYAVTTTAGRHTVRADEPVSAGGTDTGPSPLVLLLSSLTSCTAITLRMYAERKSWPLTGARVRASYVDDGTGGHVDRVISLEGDLDDDQRARLADIAERTPVTRLVKSGTQVSTTLG